jgi:hypothetical protein
MFSNHPHRRKEVHGATPAEHNNVQISDGLTFVPELTIAIRSLDGTARRS